MDLPFAQDRRLTSRLPTSWTSRPDEFLTLAEHLPDVIARIDPLLRHHYVNPAIEKITGIPRAAYLGKTIQEMNLPNEFVGLWTDQCRAVFAQGQQRTFQFTYSAIDGLRYFQARMVPEYRDGTVVSILSICTDLTQQHAALAEAERVSALAQLVGTVTHDFNNIMACISGLATELLERFDRRAGKTDVEDILACCDHAFDLTKQLLQYSRREPPEMRRVTLQEVVRTVERLIVKVLGPGIGLDLDLGNAVAIRGDLHQLQQILMNLCANARDAMQTGGRLAIRTRTAEADEVPIARGDQAAASRYALLEISDDGEGIPPHLLGRIFDPFFTTKSRERGTGLGLSNVHQMAKRHGAVIDVQSAVGTGTTFRIFFPEAPPDEIR